MRFIIGILVGIGLTIMFAGRVEKAFGISSSDAAVAAPAGTRMRVCFTPGDDCEQLAAETIAAARKSLQVQAYSFTSRTIADAIIADAQRGVVVQVLFDKSDEEERASLAAEVAHQVNTLVDVRPAIAHNKVIVIDAGTDSPVVLTGSFNFTVSAQKRNAENLLVVSGDPALASAYAQNFANRWSVSVPYEPRISKHTYSEE